MFEQLWPSVEAHLVDQFTNNSKFEGNQLTNDLNFEGSNAAAVLKMVN